MKTYFPFSGREDLKFLLPVASIANKKRVYSVLIHCEATPLTERIAYAKKIGLKPASVEKDEKTGKSIERWNFENKYPEYLKPAVLLKALFEDAPKLYHDKDGELVLKESVSVSGQEIPAEELFDKLDEEVVHEAFFDFELKRTGMSRYLPK